MSWWDRLRGREAKGSAPEPHEVAAALAQVRERVDAALARLRRGEALDASEVEACSKRFAAYYEVVGRVTGFETDADFYVESTKLSLIDTAQHGGWPMRADRRKQLMPILRDRMRAGADLWTCAALVTPALLQNQLLIALRAYERTLEDPFCARAVYRWCAESLLYYPHLNDPAALERFFASAKPPPPKQSEDLSLQERWALGAVIFPALTHEPRTTLADITAAPEALEAELARSWEIVDYESAIRILTWLSREGHRGELARYLRDLDDAPPELHSCLDNNEPALRRTSILAWDLCRAITTARRCHAVGFLPRDETWEIIQRSARRLQAAYASWEELGEDYLLGYRFFDPEQKSGAGHAPFVALLRTLPQSPWRTIPWKTPLDG